MNSAHDFLHDVSSRSPQPEPSLASWYIQGRSDRLGDRLLMYDNTGAPSLELLRFRAEWAATPGFESALRSRVERLEPFQHRAFAQVKAVEHLDGGEGLALVSTYTPGKRLSEMFQGPRLTGLHPAFATWLIRQLTPALAQLQRQGRGVTHGLVSADRIALTPEGSLVMLEHVLGGAVGCLGLTASRFWREIGVVVPADENGDALLDQRTDVVQLGLIALSILLGRQVTASDYPGHVESLLDEFAQSAGRRSPAFVAPLCLWLDRALRVSDRSFRSAEEAQDGLRELPDHGTPNAIEPTPVAMREATAALHWVQPAAAPEPIVNRRVPVEEPERDIRTVVFGHDGPVAESRRSHDQPESRGLFESGPFQVNEPVAGRPGRLPWLVACGFALLAVTEGVMMTRLLATPSKAPLGVVPILVDSPQPGDTVVVDGRQVGVTPMHLAVGSSVRSIRVVSRPTPPETPAVAAPDPRAEAAAKTEAAIAQAAQRQRSGGLRLSSPIELKVLEGERGPGSSADGPIVATAGVHELDFINTTVGFRSHQRVSIKAGEMASLAVRPPDGQLNINAAPWAQVWIDGNPAGETPLANMSIAVGEHEITFRHPQFGERRETVLVRSGASTRVSANLSR